METERITAKDLKPGQEKVVSYVGENYTVIVPDPSWTMDGDLSKLPADLQDKLTHYSKNGFVKEHAVIDPGTHSLRYPSGQHTLDDIKQNGYSLDDQKVVFLGEFDSRGNRI